MYKTFTAAAFAVLMVGGTAVAQEQQGGDIQIQGDTEINATAGTVTTTAAGSDNIAETNVGTIGGDTVQIQGDTTINATVDTVTTTAAGSGNCAKSNIGAIGAKAC